MIQRHGEHSFDIDLIEPGSTVLDIGCRGFQLHSLLHNARVIGIDPAPDIDKPIEPFIRAAVVRGPSTGVDLHISSDPQAHSIVVKGGKFIKVKPITIPQIMADYKVDQFSLIKLDCEGAEYDLMHVIADLGPIAKQITVEYHDFCGLAPRKDMDAWYADLHLRLSTWYHVAKHTREVPPWGGQPHFIDSVYQLKDAFILRQEAA